MIAVLNRPWLRFTLSTLAASGLALFAIVTFKDFVLPKTKPEVMTIIGGQLGDQGSTKLRLVRERALPAVFAVVRPMSDGTPNFAHPIATAIGLTPDGYLLVTLPLPQDALFVVPGAHPLPAKSVVKDESLGLAIVKVEASKIPVMRFAESAFLEPGTDAHVIAPKIIERTSVSGHQLASDRRTVGANELLRRFRVPSAFALPGSPVVDGDGVLGVMVDVERRLALPSDAITPMLGRFLKAKRVSHPVLAVDIEELERGAVVKRIKRGTVAEKSGLKLNDVIVSVEGETVQENRRLAELLEDFDPSSNIELLVRRGEVEQKIGVSLSEIAKK